MLAVASASFSPDRRYRYVLSRMWDWSRSVVVWVMLNPSTASALVDDPTIRRCRTFAQRWGAGGIIVVNLYGYRSTDPRALFAVPDPIGPDNDAAIAEQACRPNLFACPVNRAARFDGPPDEPGRYVCGLDDDGDLVIGERIGDLDA